MSIDIFKGIRETKERFLGNNPLVKDSTLTLLWVVLLVGFAAIFIMAFGASNIDGKTDSQTAKTLLDYGTAIASYGTAIAAMLSFYIIDTGDEKKVSVRKMAAVIIGITLLLWIGYNYTPYLKEIAANNLNYVAASMLFIFAMGTVISGYVRGKNERAKIQELMNLLKTDKK